MLKINSSILKLYKKEFDCETNTAKRAEIIHKICNDEVILDSKALISAMLQITTWQNSVEDSRPVKKISEITSNAYHRGFVTLVEEPDKNYFVIGDLHDDKKSFDQILLTLKFRQDFEQTHLIFLGDYVDRGKDRLTLINKIIALKYFLPNKIHLLRGNHELYRVDVKGNYFSPMIGASPNSHHFDLLTFLVNSERQNHKVYAQQNGLTKELIESYANFFDSMPTLALLNFNNLKICAVHGGLPRPDLLATNFYNNPSFDSFNTLLDENNIDPVGIVQKHNMLWSDPFDGLEETFKDSSEVRFLYSKEQFICFCEKYDIDMILRAHESQNDGYKSYYDDRLISLFSSGGRNINKDEIVNDHSFYEKVSPNIIQIGEKILSLNINFNEHPEMIIEEEFDPDAIRESRYLHEHHKHTKPDVVKSFDHELINNFSSSSDVVLIVDMHNLENRKYILFENGEDEVFCRHSDLSQFFGIHKNLRIVLNKAAKSITNLSAIPLEIMPKGLQVNEGGCFRGETRTVVKIGNAALLGIIF